MSQTPLQPAAAVPEGYESGWVAIHRMLREGGSWSGHERDCAYLNTGGTRFADVSFVSGLDLEGDGRAVGVVDWDLDGALDLWVGNRTGPRVRLLRSAAKPPRFVAFRPEGRTCNRDAIGARLELATRGGPTERRVKTVNAGDAYLSQSSRWVHFALGEGEAIERLLVRWPGGGVEEFSGVAPGGRYRIRQGEGRGEPFLVPANATLAPSTPRSPPFTDAARVVLSARLPLPALPITDAGGKPSSLSGGEGKPTLLNLWASWCPPCREELRVLAGGAPRLRPSGLRVFALGVEGPLDRPRALEALRALRWPHESAFATDEALAILDTFQRAVLLRQKPLPLPSSLLLDGEGKVAAIYKGAVDLSVLLRDLEGMGRAAEADRSAATPFPGRWHSALPAPDLVGLEDRLRERGLERAADEVAAGRVVRVRRTRAQILYEFGMDRWRSGEIDRAIEHFREVASLEADFFEAKSCLGILLHRTGRLAEAIVAYREAGQLRPRHVPTLYNLGLALAQAGMPEESRAQIDALEAIDPAAAGRLREAVRADFPR